MYIFFLNANNEAKATDEKGKVVWTGTHESAKYTICFLKSGGQKVSVVKE